MWGSAWRNSDESEARGWSARKGTCRSTVVARWKQCTFLARALRAGGRRERMSSEKNLSVESGVSLCRYHHLAQRPLMGPANPCIPGRKGAKRGLTRRHIPRLPRFMTNKRQTISAAEANIKIIDKARAMTADRRRGTH